MKTTILNLWAWVLLHPEAVVSAVLAVLAVVGATIANARAKGAPASWPERFIDRLAVRTRSNASNAGWSWPLVGRSIFEAAIDASAPRETQAPPPSEPGFVESRVLFAISVACVVALAWLGGCASSPLHTQAIAPSVVQREGYGTCAEAGGKIEVARAGVVTLLTSVCWAPLDGGVPAVADASAAGALDDPDAGPAIKPEGVTALVLDGWQRGMCTVPVFARGAKTLADLDPIRCAVTAPGDRLTVFRRGQRWVTR